MDTNLNLIIERLKKIPYCIGIVYSGSRKEGDFIATSDYDFTVLVSRGKSYYRVFRYNNLLVDICCATEKVIVLQDFQREKVANPELSIIAHGEIVFDKSGRMKAIQKNAQKVWKQGPINDIKEAGHLCTIFLHRLNKPNSELAFHSWNVIMDKTVRIFFELHKTWLPKPLKVENTIKKIDGDFFQLYKKIYLASSEDRVRLTKQIVLYLMNKFKLPQTGIIKIPKDEN